MVCTEFTLHRIHMLNNHAQPQGLLCEIRELQAAQGAQQRAQPHTPMPSGVQAAVEPGSAGSDMVMDAPTP